MAKGRSVHGIYRSLAHARSARVRAALASCRLCAWRCGVSRLQGPAGACRCDRTTRVFHEGVVPAGEKDLVPTYAISLSGCNMTCAFCRTGVNSQDGRSGDPLNVDAVITRIQRLAPLLRSVTILGGEPSVHLDGALEIAARIPRSLPLVWETNALSSPEGRRFLKGIPDIILADYKYGNDRCAFRLADVPRYTAAVQTTLRWARRTSRLIVRHLLMPGHWDCCLVPVIEWLAQRMPEVPVSLMTSFVPAHRALTRAELGRTIRRDEAVKARRLLAARGLPLVPWRIARFHAAGAEGQAEIWIDREGKVRLGATSASLISILHGMSDEFIISP
jgi:putative pyruvate formate lyase activating enzyme